MKKLNLAIIGQGRSGKDIHGAYYVSGANKFYNIKFVVDQDERRRKISLERYSGCEAFADYTELFARKEEIDVVVNASYSDHHFAITKELLERGFNVLCEKPFVRTTYEADVLMQTAAKNGCKLAVFHQTLYAPYFQKARELVNGDILGEIQEIDLKFNGFARRWDWQTMQKRVAGNTYNTGPHPISVALALLDHDQNKKIVFSKLKRTKMSSGDADDFAKIVIDTPNKPLVDLEIHSVDAYNGYTMKLIGTKGTFKTNTFEYSMKYIVEGENPENPLQETFLQDENGNPLYCRESLIFHEETEKFAGTAFDLGTSGLYEDLYYWLTENRPMQYTVENARDVVGVMEAVHAVNPLELKY